jgi:hypothetical protein
MSLGKQLVDSLKRLAAEGPAAVNALAWSDDARRIDVEGAGSSVRLDIADHDRYSVTLRSLTVALDQQAPADARAYLADRAAEIGRRLGYLEEPLAVWELDAADRVAQLRSSPPQRDGEAVSYWEVVLSAAERPEASIARYRWAPGMPEREPAHEPATFALIGRIAESLEGALAAPAE